MKECLENTGLLPHSVFVHGNSTTSRSRLCDRQPANAQHPRPPTLLDDGTEGPKLPSAAGG